MRISQVQIYELELLRSFAEHTFRVAFEADNDPVRFETYCSEAFSPDQFRLELEHPASRFWFGWEGAELATFHSFMCVNFAF